MYYRIETKRIALPKIDSVTLAAYILAKLGPTNHLKIHKLIYYIEAYHLAYFDQSLIDDNFKAWVHGPVVLKVWHKFKDKANVYDGLILKKEFVKPVINEVKKKLTKEQITFINDVLQEFGKRTPFDLESLTHNEKPWIVARRGIPPDAPSTNIISKELMKKYYRKKLFA